MCFYGSLPVLAVMCDSYRDGIVREDEEDCFCKNSKHVGGCVPQSQ